MKFRSIAIFAVLFMAGAAMGGSTAMAIETGGVDIHGFVSQGFLISDEYNYLTNNSKDGSFDYNEIGVNFSKRLTDKLRLGIQLFSRDLGNVANNKVTVDWAYGDYRWKDWLGIRAGRIKLPLGLYNETRDVDMLRTSVVMPQSVYADLVRDTVIAANGAGLYGNISLNAAGSLDYQVIAGAMNVDNDSGYGKWFDDRFGAVAPLDGEADFDTAYVGSLRWNTPVDGLLLGYSAMAVDSEIPVLAGGVVPATLDTEALMMTFSAEYIWNDLTLAAEYQTFETDFLLVGTKSENTSEGYYLSASYRFNDFFTLGAYYSVFYPDKDDKDGDDAAFESDAWEKDLALSLRFDINEYIVLKLEGHMVDGTARVSKQDNSDRDEDGFYYGAAKLTFSF